MTSAIRKLPVPKVCMGDEHGYCCTDDYIPQPDGSAVHRDDPMSYTPAQVANLMEQAFDVGVEVGRRPHLVRTSKLGKEEG